MKKSLGVDFSKLEKRECKKLLKLIAHISESSFRRGYQHGRLEQSIADPEFLRFMVSLNKSPYTHTKDKEGKWVETSHTSIDRLECEHYFELRDLFYQS